MRVTKRLLKQIIREEARKLNNPRGRRLHEAYGELELSQEFYSKTMGSFVSNTMSALQRETGASPATLQRVEDVLSMAVMNAEEEILRILSSELGPEALRSITN